MVGDSRQVWEPLLRNQRNQDPSRSMREYSLGLVFLPDLILVSLFLYLFLCLSLPLSFSSCVATPPPGFEHYRTGKKLLSGQTRELLGEQNSCWQQADYDAPQPMNQPEPELGEQLHFIGEFVLGSLKTSLSLGLSKTLAETASIEVYIYSFIYIHNIQPDLESISEVLLILSVKIL